MAWAPKANRTEAGMVEGGGSQDLIPLEQGIQWRGQGWDLPGKGEPPKPE